MKPLVFWLTLTGVLTLDLPGQAAEKKALLVACGDYSRAVLPIFPRLDGPPNDVQLLEELLVARFGFRTSNITVLSTGPAARELPTKQNILRHLNALVDGARAGDQLVFSFHGHGFQQMNTNPDRDPESDGLDEILIPVNFGPFDPDAGTFANVITDDELYGIHSRVGPKGATLTFIADSCHSGTIGRKTRLDLQVAEIKMDELRKKQLSDADRKKAEAELQRFQVRGVPKWEGVRGNVDTFPGLLAVTDAADLNALRKVLARHVSEPQFQEKMRNLSKRWAAQVGRNSKDPDAQAARGVVVLSAVGPNQTTPEKTFPTGNGAKWYGTFTFTLNQVLSEQPNLTGDQAIARVLQIYGAPPEIRDATPRIDAERSLASRPLFGGQVQEAKRSAQRGSVRDRPSKP